MVTRDGLGGLMHAVCDCDFESFIIHLKTVELCISSSLDRTPIGGAPAGRHCGDGAVAVCLLGEDARAGRHVKHW